MAKRKDRPDAALPESGGLPGDGYRSLFESLPVPIKINVGADARAAYANPAFLRLIGAPDFGAIEGEPATARLFEEDHEKAARNIGAIVAGLEPKDDARYRLWSFDRQQLIDVDVYTVPTQFEGRVAMFTLFVDATAVTDAEDQRAAAERRYQTLVENSADGMFVYRDAKLVYANPAGLALFGVKRLEDVVGRSIWDFIAPESRDAVAARVKTVVSSGRRQHPLREMMLDVDGRPFPAEVNSMQIPYEGGTAVLAIVRDLRAREETEEALAESQRFLQRILGATTNLIYIYDLVEHRNIYANRELHEFLGYTPQQVQELGSALFDHILHPDDAPLVAAHHAQCARAADGETLEVEYRMRHANGEWRWLYSHDAPFARDASGSVTQILGSCADITERKLSEQAIASVNALQSAIFEHMLDGFAILDGRGMHISVNPALCEMTGFSEEDLIGVSTPHPYWPPEKYDTIGAAFDRTARGEGSELEVTFMRKNGERFPALVTPSTVRDADGNTVSVFATIRDITERKRAEEELRKSAAALAAAQRLAGLGSWEYDVATGIAVWSENMYRIFDVDPEEPLALEFTYFASHVVHPDDRETVVQALSEALEGRKPYDLDYRIIRRDGSVRNVHAKGNAVRDENGRAVRMTGAAQDITGRKLVEHELEAYREGLETLVDQRTEDLVAANEALREATAAKSLFLASMSHELRTPLNSIIGFTGIMLQGLTGELTSEQRTQLEMVNRAGRQLLGLVSDVLDLERIEAGRIELDVDDVDVRKLATTLAETVRPMAEDVGLTLGLDLDRAPASIRTDRAKLEQILLNFLSNAVKYTEVGGITLVVESHTDGSLAFAVQDTGIGIAREDQARIFEEFRQLPAHRGAKHPGSGLGLAISRQLADLLGGRIELESTPGEGSIFTLVLPPR